MRRELAREWRFFARDRQAIAAVIAAAVLAMLAVALGLKDTAEQRASIAALQASTAADLEHTLADQPDPGIAAYYSFRLVFDPPGALAFAARGVRDELPWKHRIRLLALEGQIYENDPGNPELGQVGRFDYAFLVTVLAPLLVILLLHDIVAGERRQNRFDLLTVTAGSIGRWLRWRTGVRLTALALALVTPFVVAAVAASAPATKTASLALATLLYVVAWGLVVVWVARRVGSAATTAATLLAIWTVLVLVIPLSAAGVAEQRISVPQGGEILLLQREVVNRAWDLPKADTMKVFAESNPEWAGHEPAEEGFDWGWYYAFQHVGDESVAALSTALRQGVRERDEFMGKAALLSPPLLVDRLFARAAETDIAAFQRYEACVREFHTDLRLAHYPMIYGVQDYDVERLLEIENTRACL